MSDIKIKDTKTFLKYFTSWSNIMAQIFSPFIQFILKTVKIIIIIFSFLKKQKQ